MSKPERRLHLGGPLTVAVCETLQGELAAALDDAEHVVLGLDADAQVDLSFLQLLIAAQRSAAARGKRVTLATPPAGAFAAALKASGYAAPPAATQLDQIFLGPGGRIR